MAILKIDDAVLLGFTYATERLGSEFRFGIRKTIKIDAAKIALSGTEGEVGDQAEELDKLIATDDYVEIEVNGKSLAEKDTAKLISFQVKEGPWVRYTEGTITVEVYELGNIDNMSGGDYEGLFGPLDEDNAQFLKDFTESFSFNQGANSIGYDHTVQVSFSEKAEVSSAEEDDLRDAASAAACQFCKDLIDTDSRPEFAWLDAFEDFYSDINTDYKRFLTETLDAVNNTVSVSEKFDTTNLKDNDKYAFKVNQVLEVTENGIINITENGSIQGITLDATCKDARELPEDHLCTEIDNARKANGRMQEMFDHYKEAAKDQDCDEDKIPDLKVSSEGDDGDCSCPTSKGYVVLIEQGVTRNSSTGEISYTIKGTNDEKIDDKATHVFSRTLRVTEYDESDPKYGYWEVGQNGKFVGIGPSSCNNSDEPSYDKAKEQWEDEKDDIKENLRKYAGVDDPQKYHVTMSNGHNFQKGEVSYNIVYSDHPQYAPEEEGYKKITLNRTTSQAEAREDIGGGVTDPYRYQYNVETVINHPGETEVLQKRHPRELPSATQKYTVVGKRDEGECTLDTLLDDLMALDPTADRHEDGTPGISPGDEDCSFLKSCTYTWNEDNDKILNITFTWN